MTVSELIEALKTLPGDLPVTRTDHEWDEVRVAGVAVITGKNGIGSVTGKRVIIKH